MNWIEIIEDCVNLEVNWDGYDAIPTFKEIGEKAKQIVRSTTYPIEDIYP
jgi:hypothetical protein